MRKIFCYSIISLLCFLEAFGQEGYYSCLEQAIKNKDSVISLTLKKKHLKTFPKEILEMKNIQRLDLSRNSIKEIPSSIDTLKYLHYLNIAQNYLTSLPKQMAQMPIDTLILWDNQIKYFDSSFSKLHLKYLDIRAISMTRKQQKAIKALFPQAKIKKDHPCNCGG